MKITIELDAPVWLKRAALLVGPLAAICIAGLALAAPKQFTSNETLTASDLNASFGDLDTRMSAVEATVAPTGSLTTTNVTASGDLIVSGVANLGLHVSTTCTQAPVGYTDCTCGADEVAISGGAFCHNTNGDGILSEFRRADRGGGNKNAWRSTCADRVNGTRFMADAHAVCARIQSN